MLDHPKFEFLGVNKPLEPAESRIRSTREILRVFFVEEAIHGVSNYLGKKQLKECKIISSPPRRATWITFRQSCDIFH